MQKIPRKPRLRGVPRIAFAAALTALTLWTVGVAATAHSLSDAAERLRQETALPLALLRYEMGGEEADELSLGASLALSLTPILADARSEVTQAWSSELQLPPDETKPDTEDHEGTTLSDAQTGETVPRGADNGVPSRTLQVGDPSGYTVLGNVCINNGSKCTLDASQLPCDSIQLFRFGWELLFGNIGSHPVLDLVAQCFSLFSSLDEVVKFFFHRLFSEHEIKVSRVLPIIRVILCLQ